MPKCNKCFTAFPNLVLIEGKKHNLSNRRYCLACSPFGQRNNKRLHIIKERNWVAEGPCKLCGSESNKKAPRTSTCYSCLNKRHQLKRQDKLYCIIGEKCWKCNYDLGRYMLDFHHMRDKLFQLTARNIGNHRWEKVWNEAQKCVLLCCRCHREVHCGIISKEEINLLYQNKWRDIWSRNSEARVSA